MIEQCEEFKAGQQMFLDGIKYNAPEMITAQHHNGWIDMERSSRCNYQHRHWNKNGSVKTSADITTLFT